MALLQVVARRDLTAAIAHSGTFLGAVAVWGLWALSTGAVASLFPPGQQARAAALQIVLIGLGLCAILLFRPRGILGEARMISRHIAPARPAAGQSETGTSHADS